MAAWPRGDEAALASVGSHRCSEFGTYPTRLLHFLGSVLGEPPLRNHPPSTEPYRGLAFCPEVETFSLFGVSPTQVMYVD